MPRRRPHRVPELRQGLRHHHRSDPGRARDYDRDAAADCRFPDAAAAGDLPEHRRRAGPDAARHHRRRQRRHGQCHTATSTVTIVAVNSPPTADDDAYSVAESGTLNVPAPGVLDGDVDAEGDAPITAVLVTGPVNASAFTLNADGSFAYTHNGSETTMIGIPRRSNAGIRSCAQSRGRRVGGGGLLGEICAMQMCVYSLLGLRYLNLSFNRLATS